VTSDNTPTFTGTAEANSTVTVISSVNGTLGTTTADGSGNWSYTAGTMTSGAHNITATATDAAGNTSSASSSLSITIDTSAPSITNVTSIKEDGTYGIGETIVITVTFDQMVLVTGVPSLELETGIIDRTADYTSGTGTTTLSFTYTAQSGDESADLDYKATGSLVLNGGTIQDAAGNNATLTLAAPDAAGSLGANKAIVVQAFPSVTLSVGTLSIAEAAGTSAVTATLSQTSSQDVVVSLIYSGTAVNSTDYTGPTSITVLAGSLSANAAANVTAIQDTDPEGDETIIIDIFSVQKGFESGAQQQTITLVDDDAPTVVSVTVPSDGIYKAGQNLDFTVTFIQTVTINTSGGVPSVPVTIGSTVVNAALSGTVTGSTTALFHYTVQTGDEDINGISVGSAIALNGATIQNVANMDAITTLNGVANTANVKVDAIVPHAPVVTGISADTNIAGDGVTSDKTLLINGTSEANANINVFIGAVTIGTVVADGSGNWQFDHTATALADGSYSITATATDAAGNTSVSSAVYPVTIDTAQPGVVITGNMTSPANSPFIATFTFSQEVYNFSIGDITVGNGAASNFVAANASVYTATITPASNGLVTIDVAAGVANDMSGNTNTAATQYSLTYDTVRPVIVMSGPLNNIANGPFTTTFTFSEAVTGFAGNDVIVGNGTISSFSATTASVYTAMVYPSGDGTVTIDVNANVATDAAGNQNTAATRYSVSYDGTRPTVVISSKNINHQNGSFVTEFKFSEPVIGFTQSDVKVNDGTIASFVSIGSDFYYVQVDGVVGLIATVDVPGGAVHDNSFNLNIPATTLTVEFDRTPPTVLCKDMVLYLDDSGNANLTAEEIDNGSNDQSGIESLAIDKSSFSCSNLGDNTVVLTVADKSGNMAVCNATVTVKEKITVITKDITLMLDAAGKASITPDQINDGSFGSCGIVSYQLDKTDFNCSHVGSNTVTLTLTGTGGSTGSATAQVTVEAVNMPPVFDPVADITVQEDANPFNVTVTGINNGDCMGDVQQVETITVAGTGNIIKNIAVAYIAGQGSAVLTVSLDENVFGEAVVTITARDNGGTANGGVDSYSSSFKVMVQSVNDMPVVTGTLDPQKAEVGNDFSYTLPSGLFTDIDEGDELTCSVTAETGNMPDWLKFDASTLRFSGTPAESDKGNFLLTITAVDKSGASVSAYLEVIVYQPAGSVLAGYLYQKGELLNGGAMVALYEGVDAVPSTVFKLITRTMVSSHGSFGFYNLSPGKYIVEATITDTEKYGNLLTTYFDRVNNWNDASAILLDNNSTRNIDMVMLEKPEQDQGHFIISGFIIKMEGSFEKSGMIEKSTDADSGEPLPGVNVLLKQNGQIMATCISDENGHYEFTNLSEGVYQIEVMVPGFSQQDVVAVQMDETANPEEKVNFTVWEGNNVITDIEIYRLPVEVKVYPNPTMGKVTVDIKNRNLSFSEIRVYSMTGQLIMEKKDIQGDRTVLDLSGCDPGVYLLRVTTGHDQQTYPVILK
jgi:hypothetical protein